MTAGPSSAALHRTRRHDRMVVSAAIGALTLLSWMHLARLTGSLGAAASGRARHAAMGIPEMAAWGWPLTVWGVWLGRPA